MPRTAIAPITPLGPQLTIPVAAGGLDIAMTAGDATNDNSIILNGPGILFLHNTGAGARTVTIGAVPIGGRDGDITAYSLGAGEYGAIKIHPHGYVQSDGTLYVDPEHAEVLMAFVRS